MATPTKHSTTFEEITVHARPLPLNFDDGLVNVHSRRTIAAAKAMGAPHTASSCCSPAIPRPRNGLNAATETLRHWHFGTAD